MSEHSCFSESFKIWSGSQAGTAKKSGCFRKRLRKVTTDRSPTLRAIREEKQRRFFTRRYLPEAESRAIKEARAAREKEEAHEAQLLAGPAKRRFAKLEVELTTQTLKLKEEGRGPSNGRRGRSRTAKLD